MCGRVMAGRRPGTEPAVTDPPAADGRLCTPSVFVALALYTRDDTGVFLPRM
jgi:hypothetical protein